MCAGPALAKRKKASAGHSPITPTQEIPGTIPPGRVTAPTGAAVTWTAMAASARTVAHQEPSLDALDWMNGMAGLVPIDAAQTAALIARECQTGTVIATVQPIRTVAPACLTATAMTAHRVWFQAAQEWNATAFPAAVAMPDAQATAPTVPLSAALG